MHRKETSMKKVLKIAVAIMIILIIPVLMDYLILGNNVPSNIGNDVWAGFLGSYIGGIATLLAVFITINDNNKKIRQQKIEEDKEQAEQRRLSIKPYLDTRFTFFDQSVCVGINDRVFDMMKSEIKYTRFNLTDSDRKRIQINREYIDHVYLKYSVRNIGAGSAVDMVVKVNGRDTIMAIAKDESINLFFLISLQGEKQVPLNLSFDFWDTESRGHYLQEEKLLVEIVDDELKVVPVLKSKAIEI